MPTAPQPLLQLPMRCPFCHVDNDSVRDTRVMEDGRAIKRRRYCHSCRRRFATVERITGGLQVIKKNGQREPFSRSKVELGLERACWKRKISSEDRARMAESIEAKLIEDFESEVHSTEIGQLCMQELAAIDQVAFVRFASVYREFQDVQDFVQEIRPILRSQPTIAKSDE
jgi:transcriptional repressor NrdR